MLDQAAQIFALIGVTRVAVDDAGERNAQRAILLIDARARFAVVIGHLTGNFGMPAGNRGP